MQLSQGTINRGSNPAKRQEKNENRQKMNQDIFVHSTIKSALETRNIVTTKHFLQEDSIYKALVKKLTLG